MSEYKVKLSWKNSSEDFSYANYDRTHFWKFGGGIEVKASAAPEYKGKAELVNPEEAFVASLSSCHLLTFLAVASFKKFKVKSYEDNAFCLVAKNDSGKMAVKRVTLRPKVEFHGEIIPTIEQYQELHKKAHEDCFISNSVNSEVVVDPVF